MENFSSKRLLKTENASITPVRKMGKENEAQAKPNANEFAFQEKTLQVND